MSLMPFTPFAIQAREYGDFYAPRMEILIDGANLPRDITKDIVSLVYEDNIGKIDTFTLTVNNWDDRLFKFRYIGSETAADLVPGSENYALRTVFEPCGKEVEIRLGYGNDLVTMVRGTFTTMQPQFTDGSAVLKVTGVNVLDALRRKPYTTAWSDKKDSEIAEDLAQRTDGGKKRFPLPIFTDPNAKKDEKPTPVVNQRNTTDLDFLFERAGVRGYVLLIQEEDRKAGTPRRLYFGPAKAGAIPGFRSITYRLTWGRSLMDFQPTISTATQVTSVTVKGWNRTSKEKISRTVTLKDPRVTINADLYRLLECRAREEIVVDEPLFTNCQARERAIAILTEQLKKIVTVAGVKVVGLPHLRAGQVVQIDGVGARLSGRYFVTKSTHTFDDNGYLTTFDCRREQPKDGG